MTAPVAPSRQKLFVALVSDSASEAAEPKQMVIVAATRDDAQFIALRRASADGMTRPRVERMATYFAS